MKGLSKLFSLVKQYSKDPEIKEALNDNVQLYQKQVIGPLSDILIKGVGRRFILNFHTLFNNQFYYPGYILFDDQLGLDCENLPMNILFAAGDLYTENGTKRNDLVVIKGFG